MQTSRSFSNMDLQDGCSGTTCPTNSRLMGIVVPKHLEAQHKLVHRCFQNSCGGVHSSAIPFPRGSSSSLPPPPPFPYSRTDGQAQVKEEAHRFVFAAKGYKTAQTNQPKTPPTSARG